MDKKENPGQGSGGDTPRPPSRARVIASAVGEFESKPELLADALKTHLGDDGVARLVALWNQ
jgi:ParB family chromosome partitioning protein